jgi:hypothetical protein
MLLFLNLLIQLPVLYGTFFLPTRTLIINLINNLKSNFMTENKQNQGSSNQQKPQERSSGDQSKQQRQNDNKQSGSLGQNRKEDEERKKQPASKKQSSFEDDDESGEIGRDYKSRQF